MLTPSPLAWPPLSGAPDAGGISDFWGVVRGAEGGRPIAGLRYEWHPRMALAQLPRVAAEAAEEFPLLPGSMLHHRVGFVPAGEASLFLRACCAHRGPALAATARVVERLKEIVPIWKRTERMEDGGSRMAGNG